MSFEEICAAITPNINRLMRYYRYVEVDIPDMIAHGFMRLWEELSKNPNLLAGLDHGGVTKWVMYRSGSSHYKKFYRREMYLDELATRSGDPDAFIIEGYDHSHVLGHASHAEAVDLRVDIEQTMRVMAEKHSHSQKHLAALYYITTSVGLEDASALAGCSGTKQSWWLTSVVKPLREELCELFGLNRPGKSTWQEKWRGGNKAPFQHLLKHYETQGNERMAETLRNLCEHESSKALQARLDVPQSQANYLRRTAHQELNRAYKCRT